MFQIPGVRYLPLCEICRSIASGDLVLAQDQNYVVLVHSNPYNNGHLIVTLRAHKTLQEASTDELTALFEIAKRCITLLSNAYRPHGFNIDIVQEPHVALHIVPRWNGDASFVSVFHNIRVIAETPYHTLRYLRELIDRYSFKLLC